MKDINKLVARYKQFGGGRLVWQYIKMGVFGTAFAELVKCLLAGRSPKTIYPKITQKVDHILCNQYAPLLSQGEDASIKMDFVSNSDNENRDYRIWFCWLQGIDQAPEMVKVCLKSQKRLYGKRVTIVDAQNYKQWAKLPDYIEEKYRKGIIPGALFSDLLRLELLINHGGTWIDSSVLADPTYNCNKSNLWKPTLAEIDQAELFIFRYLKYNKVYGISNWFIHAKPGNPLLMDVRNMLLAYWKDYNCTVDYYIFHLFFVFASKRYPKLMAAMPRGNSFHSVLLRDRLSTDFDTKRWNELTDHVCFHKLNYRLESEAKSNANSYWNHILKEVYLHDSEK